MKEPIRVESVAHMNLTPELIAKAFWAMSDDQQADFFDALAGEVEAYNAESDRPAYNYGEMQWCYLHDKLQQRGGRALSMYLALSVFAFQFSQDHCGLR